ncbi:hypothetical protein NA57DRAFT_37426 [Rhizodiscina lignyota]|uniref:MHYT domain-containing protein n=1 Tax=Rhizodiscina lignyota TaxID=1504668 RepID=A0A9P4IIM9_9PEZI|nr:hypothetical protein NA57DRAFT_37426 [Rhizodiscina lignyota]
MTDSPYKSGDWISFRLEPGIVVASYFVSLTGAITTVELLHRRREGKGLYRWMQNGAVSVSFGLVAIWCMHFVGNRAIVLGDGSKEIQLYYNSGFTALSAFLPVVFLFFGFTSVELRQPGQRFFWPSLLIASVIAGLAITGMHYVGNFGITNYHVRNPAQYIVGAAAIAIFACIVALTMFYYFKERWINSWWRRVMCAIILAGAVSGMHWLGTMGTTYQLSSGTVADQGNRNTNLIIAIVISLLACFVCLMFAFLTQVRKKQLADRAQHVVLASVTFDPDGKILVTQEGLMPSQKITKQYNQRSFNDEFNVAHPVFQWLFRVSHNWGGVQDLIPAMRSHLRSMGSLKNTPANARPHSPSTRSVFEDATGVEEDYSVIFREHFCVAAAELAEHLQTRMPDLGVLYSDIMMTGSMAPEFMPRGRRPGVAPGKSRPSDVEEGMIHGAMFGRGQLLFLVREVDRPEASRLMAAGYRFAAISQVEQQNARSMQVPQAEFTANIKHLRSYCATNAVEQTSGTFIACFAMRAAVKTTHGSWEVLVPKDDLKNLPRVEITPGSLKNWHQRVMGRLDGMTVNQCMKYLGDRATDAPDDEERSFTKRLLLCIAELQEIVPERFFEYAIFSSKPVIGPESGVQGPATTYAFCIIPDVHSSSIKHANDTLTYTPFSFFKSSQRVYKNSPDHAYLAQRIHREFASILAAKEANKLNGNGTRPHSFATHSSQSQPKRKWLFAKNDGSGRTSRRPSSSKEADSASQRYLFKKGDDGESGLSSPQPTHPWGGIMVSSDVIVDSNVKEESHMEMQDLGLVTEAGVGGEEQPTYADELFKITSARWQRA